MHRSTLLAVFAAWVSSCGQPVDQPIAGDGAVDGEDALDASGDSGEPIEVIPPGEAEDYLAPYHSDARGINLIIRYEEHTAIPVPDSIRCDITLPGPWNPEDIAFGFLEVLTPLYGVDLQEQLVLDYSGCDDEYGGCAVRYHQRIGSHDVENSSLDFFFDPTHAITLISSSISPVIDSLEQNVSSDEAFEIAYDYLVNEEHLSMSRDEAERLATSELIILDMAFKGQDSQGGRLHWYLTFDFSLVYVDAATGDVTLYDSTLRQVLRREITEGYDQIHVIFRDFDPAINDCDLDEDCAPMRDILADVYDYWLNEHSRESYDDESGVMYAYIDWRSGLIGGLGPYYLPISGCRSMSGSCSLYFDHHLVWSDAVAHEMTHNLIYHTCGLDRVDDETYALEEALGDVMAVFFEYFAYGVVDWSIGENHVGNTWCGDPGWNEACPMRNLADPHNCGFDPSLPPSYQGCGGPWDYSNDGCPDQYSELLGPSDALWSSGGGEHRNSTIVSHAMYLMVEGGEKNDITVTARSIEQIEPVLWMTIADSSSWLRSDARFVNFSDSMIRNCETIHGVGSGVCATVMNALGAVGIYDRDGDRIADAYDNCIEDWNPRQDNCDADDDADPAYYVNQRWRGDACDPDPCVELATAPRRSDEVIGWFDDHMLRRVGEWVDMTIQTWGGIPTATGETGTMSMSSRTAARASGTASARPSSSTGAGFASMRTTARSMDTRRDGRTLVGGGRTTPRAPMPRSRVSPSRGQRLSP